MNPVILKQHEVINNNLHYAIETHNKDLIKFIIDCDAENNYLRKEANARGQKPFDLDTKNIYFHF